MEIGESDMHGWQSLDIGMNLGQSVGPIWLWISQVYSIPHDTRKFNAVVIGGALHGLNKSAVYDQYSNI